MNDESHSTNKMGRKMGFIAWGFLLFILYLFFADRIEQQFNPNQNPQSRSESEYREVILKQNRGGHYVVSGTINNYPVVFMLDTGATGVSIPESVANQIGLQKGAQYSTYTANGIGTGFQTTVKTLAFGSIEVGPMRAGINPNMAGNEVLLGMSVLKDLEFTQKQDTLILRQYR